MPALSAPHAEWYAYAVSRNIPPDAARGMTRDQLRATLLPRPPLTGAPDLERHEQDPETLTAMREARRKPWEQAR